MAHTERTIGEAVQKDRSYTVKQLMDATGAKKSTMNKWRFEMGLDRFFTPLGHFSQITGEQYFSWLEWLRSKSSGQPNPG